MFITLLLNLRRTLIVLLCPAIIVLAGCAGGSPWSQTKSSPPDFSNFSGDWFFSSVSDSSTNTDYIDFALGGLLSAKQGSVTGLMRVLSVKDERCLDTGSVLSFTGTVQTDGTFSISSNSIKGQTLTISGSIGNSSGIGTGYSPYKISGSCQDTGTSLGSEFFPLNGTFEAPIHAGNIIPNGAAPFQGSTVTATFHESGNVNSQAEFPLTGGLLFQGSPCVSTLTMDPDASYISGGGINATLTGTDNTGKPVTISLTGYYSNDIVIYYTVTSGSCNGQVGATELPG